MGDNVKITLYEGMTTIGVSTITDSAPDTGSYNWLIPAGLTPATTYRIRVSTLDGSIGDTGDHFTITSPVRPSFHEEGNCLSD